MHILMNHLNRKIQTYAFGLVSVCLFLFILFFSTGLSLGSGGVGNYYQRCGGSLISDESLRFIQACDYN